MANLQRLTAADVAGARSAADQAALEDLQAQKAAVAADRDAKVTAQYCLLCHTRCWCALGVQLCVRGRDIHPLHPMFWYVSR